MNSLADKRVRVRQLGDVTVDYVQLVYSAVHVCASCTFTSHSHMIMNVLVWIVICIM